MRKWGIEPKTQVIVAQQLTTRLCLVLIIRKAKKTKENYYNTNMVLMRERDEKVASQTQEIDSNSMTPYH